MASSEPDQEGSIYRRMNEFKKKIALVEGKRKALYGKYEREKTDNRNKEQGLIEELKVV